MKYAPKKVFILENGVYREISYNELKQLEQADKSYMDKFFLPLHGMLMEVTEETYKEYYRDKRRQKYMTVEQLRKAFLLLSPDERELITAIYIQNLTEREFAKKKGVYHNAVHKRKLRVLEKLKKFLDK